MHLLNVNQRLGELSFFALILVIFPFCIPFLKPTRFSWSEMNLYLQGLVFLLAAAIFLHASLSLSVSNTLRLFGLAFFISYLAEIVGMRYPGLFGNLYSYNSALSPILPGGVPVIVVLMWFILAYTALKFLYPIPSRLSFAPSMRRLLLKGGLGGFYIMATDFFIDPLGTYVGLWVWHEPGGYFGTPWRNFVGWFLVGMVICGLYLLVEKPLPLDRVRRSYYLDWFFVLVSILLSLLCFLACLIHLGNGWPVAFSLIVLGPCWAFWMVFTRRVQPGF